MSSVKVARDDFNTYNQVGTRRDLAAYGDDKEPRLRRRKCVLIVVLRIGFMLPDTDTDLMLKSVLLAINACLLPVNAP